MPRNTSLSPGHKTAARDDPGGGPGGVEENAFARPGDLEGHGFHARVLGGVQSRRGCRRRGRARCRGGKRTPCGPPWWRGERKVPTPRERMAVLLNMSGKCRSQKAEGRSKQEEIPAASPVFRICEPSRNQQQRPASNFLPTSCLLPSAFCNFLPCLVSCARSNPAITGSFSAARSSRSWAPG